VRGMVNAPSESPIFRADEVGKVLYLATKRILGFRRDSKFPQLFLIIVLRNDCGFELADRSERRSACSEGCWEEKRVNEIISMI
jgi:hypothetical protein